MNALEQHTSQACRKAMEACIKKLQLLGWTPDEIADAAIALTERLRPEGRQAIDEAVEEFTKVVDAGSSYQWAIAAFYAPFVVAGIKVANEYHASVRGA